MIPTPIVLGRKVWLGAGVTVVPGLLFTVRVGTGSTSSPEQAQDRWKAELRFVRGRQ